MTATAALRSDLDARRRYFAEELEASCGLTSASLIDAFAAVPREAFLRPGPWTILGADAVMAMSMAPGAARAAQRLTPDADPARVYHNVGVAIDPARQLYNGHPGTIASWIQRLQLAPGRRVLHIGAGLGYYTAIVAHIVGPAGRVVAHEIDPDLAAAARANLASYPWVEVKRSTGVTDVGRAFDAILVNAGATHAPDAWLDGLAPGGRMILPLTFTIEQAPGPISKGAVALITRRDEAGDPAPDYAASLVGVVAIYSCEGVRDAELNARLRAAFTRGDGFAIARLRRDVHEASAACWLHGDRFCLSKTGVPSN